MDEQTSFEWKLGRQTGNQIFSQGGSLLWTCGPGLYQWHSSWWGGRCRLSQAVHTVHRRKVCECTLQNRQSQTAFLAQLQRLALPQAWESPKICPAGRYGEAEELTKGRLFWECSPGLLLPRGIENSTAVACPSGYFSQRRWLQARKLQYAQRASSVLLQQRIQRLAQQGRYGNVTGLGTEDCAGPCPPGPFY